MADKWFLFVIKCLMFVFLFPYSLYVICVIYFGGFIVILFLKFKHKNSKINFNWKTLEIEWKRHS